MNHPPTDHTTDSPRAQLLPAPGEVHTAEQYLGFVCDHLSAGGELADVGATVREALRLHAAELAVEPPADRAAVRCPSCEHEARYHDVDGRCWFTVEQGVPERDAVCSCLLRRMADETPAAPDLAAADNPTPLRWGLDDVLYGDDDTMTVLLSGPSGEPYWLELEPERAAALRDSLAGPEAQPDAGP